MNRGEILDKAKEIINGARQENYGNPESNFSTIAALWSAYMSAGTNYDITIYSHDVANLMILMKVARLVNKPDHMDSWIDIAGYAANGGEITSDDD